MTVTLDGISEKFYGFYMVGHHGDYCYFIGTRSEEHPDSYFLGRAEDEVFHLNNGTRTWTDLVSKCKNERLALAIYVRGINV